MHAGTPFVILNTLCGALAAYGFAGLRYTASAIILFAVILVLQSLIAIQLLIFCVYATPNQVYYQIYPPISLYIVCFTSSSTQGRPCYVAKKQQGSSLILWESGLRSA